jgi:hypothetical protein
MRSSLRLWWCRTDAMARDEFIGHLAPEARAAHVALARRTPRLAMAYRPAIELPSGQRATGRQKDNACATEEVAKASLRTLEEMRRIDVGNGATGCGPQREDVEVLLDGRPGRGRYCLWMMCCRNWMRDAVRACSLPAASLRRVRAGDRDRVQRAGHFGGHAPVWERPRSSQGPNEVRA